MPSNFACRICGKTGFASRDSLTKHVCSGKAEKVVEVESGAANITAPRNADVVINPVSGAQSIVPANGAIVQAVCDQKEATVGASDKLKCPVQLCPFIADRQSKLDRHMLTKKCQALKANELSDAGLKTTGECVAANVPMSSLTEKHCGVCNAVVALDTTDEQYLVLKFGEDTSVCTFQEAVARNVGLPSTDEQNTKCHFCDETSKHVAATSLRCGQEFLVVQLNLFESQEGEDERRLANRRIKEFDSAKANVGGCDYETVGVVMHH